MICQPVLQRTCINFCSTVQKYRPIKLVVNALVRFCQCICNHWAIYMTCTFAIYFTTFCSFSAVQNNTSFKIRSVCIPPRPTILQALLPRFLSGSCSCARAASNSVAGHQSSFVIYRVSFSHCPLVALPVRVSEWYRTIFLLSSPNNFFLLCREDEESGQSCRNKHRRKVLDLLISKLNQTHLKWNSYQY